MRTARRRGLYVLAIAITALGGCGSRTGLSMLEDAARSTDSGHMDAGASDAGTPRADGGSLDSTIVRDGGPTDGGGSVVDTGVADASADMDSGGIDAALARDAGFDAGDANLPRDAGFDAGDAGVDAGSCEPRPEMCNGLDDDCDGVVDGPRADLACSLPNALANCLSARCRVSACVSGWGDCNGRDGDGCEADLTTELRCGACGISCSPIETCRSGLCSPAREDVLTAGGVHTALIRPSGTAYCWGSNQEAQCGSAMMVTSQAPAPVRRISDFTHIAAGSQSTCGVSAGGNLYCWGTSTRGALGLGPVTRVDVPTRVTGIRDAVQVSVGVLHACVRHATGEVSCWGANNDGEVGDGTMTQRGRPVRVPGITDAVELGLGGSYSCVLRATGQVRCWGANDRSQLGDGTLVHRSTPTRVPGLPSDISAIHTSEVFACAETSGGELWCWGYKGFGQFCQGGPVFPIDHIAERPRRVRLPGPVRDVAGTFFHATFVLRNGQVWSCGDGQGGGLGDGSGHFGESWVPTRVSLTDAVSVASGLYHTCVLRATGQVACWGRNEFMTVGDGTSIPRRSPLVVMGLPP